MVQQCMRSYFYFVSFAKKKGITCAPRKGSVFARARKVYKPLPPRPDWDNTIHDLSAWKLSPKELEARKIAYKTLPEHRVKRSVSSATPSLSCNDGPEQCTDQRGPTTSTAIDKPAAREEDGLTAVSRTKHLKNVNSGRRGGKENLTCAAVDETHQPLSKHEGKRHTGSILKTKAIESVRKISNPLQPADALRSRGARSVSGDRPQSPHHTIAQDTELGENQKLRASPTVDFDEEVKQFEERTKFLVQAVKPPLDFSLRASRKAKSKKQRFMLPKILHTQKVYPKEVMDKSDSSDYDSSISGPWGNSICRFQKGMHPVPRHHHHRKHYSRTVQVEAAAATTTGTSQPSKYNHWESQPQNELVYFKQPVDPTIKPRTKVARRHFGSIQTSEAKIASIEVQKTSPIGDGKVNYEESANDHLSLQQDFQRHMLKCQHNLTQEFKEFKISISKQIMNLQLDIDTVLELQKKMDSHPAETRAPSSYRTGQRSPVPEGVGENVDLPKYSSVNFKKDVMKPASPSSGESSHMPLFSCYDGSQYAASRKSTHSVHGSEDGLRPSSGAAAAAENHVFDNPIYHVQTSSEKEGESSDSDASISSEDLAKFLASRGGHQHLKSESHLNGGDYIPSNEASLPNQGTTSPNCPRMLGIEDKKNNSLVPYGFSQNQEEAVARLAESDNLDNSYRENRIESNGHAQSNSNRLGSSNDQCLRPSARRYQTEVSRPVSKNGTPPSPGIGTYRTQPLVVAEGDPIVLHDLELRLGNSGVNSAVNSAVNSDKSSPKDNRNRLSPSVSRPLFTTGNWSNVSNSSIILMNAKDGHQVQDRERSEAAQERPGFRDSKPAKNADEGELFTLRGWSAAFLQPTENFQKDIPSVNIVETPVVPQNRTRTPGPSKKEIPRETDNGKVRFQGRCARGGVAWTVNEPPPSSVKKLRNAPVL